MRVASEVSDDKLRGGFYTPPGLVDDVTRIALGLLRKSEFLRVLEPSAGDGAFLPAVDRYLTNASVTSVEIDPVESAKLERRMDDLHLEGDVINDSLLAWADERKAGFDLVIGNLPFVRFQFISQRDKELALAHGLSAGVDVAGVANLWLSMLVASLRQLRNGGAFSLIVPSECFTGISAGRGREWLMARTEELRADIYPPGTYPGVLQEIVVLSGIWRGSKHQNKTVRVRVVDRYFDHAQPISTSAGVIHTIAVGPDNWMELFLTSSEVSALNIARDLKTVHPLRETAKFEVAAVTGANAFFSLTNEQVRLYGLSDWVTPLLPKMRLVEGLEYTSHDHSRAGIQGALSNLLSIKPGTQNALIDAPGLSDYISAGEAQGLHLRFKTRNRTPWYAVPSVRSEQLLMSKRSHLYPRVAYNAASAVTTDTIYRGRVVDANTTPTDVAVGFHNSLTLLTAELEGRSFGGGVLELVPSEVGRLLLPGPRGMGESMSDLDHVLRSAGGSESENEILIEATNRLVSRRHPGLDDELLTRLDSARRTLQERRLRRN